MPFGSAKLGQIPPGQCREKNLPFCEAKRVFFRERPCRIRQSGQEGGTTGREFVYACDRPKGTILGQVANLGKSALEASKSSI